MLSACSLKYVTNDKMTNLTLRERLGIDKQNYPMASRVIKDTLIAGKIKEEKCLSLHHDLFLVVDIHAFLKFRVWNGEFRVCFRIRHAAAVEGVPVV